MFENRNNLSFTIFVTYPPPHPQKDPHWKCLCDGMYSLPSYQRSPTAKAQKIPHLAGPGKHDNVRLSPPARFRGR